MSNLIPILSSKIKDESVQLINARELHHFLEIGKRFSDWIKSRIKEYSFVENQDFIAISQKREIGTGRGKVEYHITLDMGKELSMVERSEKGQQARKYFIECEKRLLRSMRNAGNEPQPLIPTQRRHIQQRVKYLVKHQVGTGYALLWGQIKDKFKVGTYKDIDATLYPALCQFLACEPEANAVVLTDERQAYDQDMIDALLMYNGMADEVYQQIKQLMASLYDAVHESYAVRLLANYSATCQPAACCHQARQSDCAAEDAH